MEARRRSKHAGVLWVLGCKGAVGTLVYGKWREIEISAGKSKLVEANPNFKNNDWSPCAYKLTRRAIGFLKTVSMFHVAM
jgi:hypothetical protein